MLLRRYFPMGFAIVFALLSSVSVFHFLREKEGQAQAQPAPMMMMPVVLAKGPMEMGQKINENDLVTVSWAEKAAPKDGFQSPRSLVGRTVKLNIKSNEPILESKLLEKGDGFASLIPPDMRAVTIPIPFSESMSQLLEKGTTVDVLSLVMFESSKVIKVKTIVEKARVINVFKGNDENGKSETRLSNLEIMLLLTPEQANGVIAAMAQGSIQITVRGFEPGGASDGQ